MGRRSAITSGIVVVCVGLAFGVNAAWPYRETHTAGNNGPTDIYATLAPGTTKAIHVPQVLDGKQTWIKTYIDGIGQFCYQEEIAGSGPSTACTASREHLHALNGPVVPLAGAIQDPGSGNSEWKDAWVGGFAAPSIARLEVVSADCTRNAVELDSDGVFLYARDGRQLEQGGWPEVLVAYNSAGEVVRGIALNLEPPLVAANQAKTAHIPGARSC